MPEKVEVIVYTAGECPATRATVEKLSMLRLPAEVKPISEVKYLMRRNHFSISPVVVVWMGEGKTKRAFLNWEGHRPQMLEIAHKVATKGV